VCLLTSFYIYVDDLDMKADALWPDNEDDDDDEDDEDKVSIICSVFFLFFLALWC
jgi:hypothetical protein